MLRYVMLSNYPATFWPQLNDQLRVSFCHCELVQSVVSDPEITARWISESCLEFVPRLVETRAVVHFAMDQYRRACYTHNLYTSLFATRSHSTYYKNRDRKKLKWHINQQLAANKLKRSTYLIEFTLINTVLSI